MKTLVLTLVISALTVLGLTSLVTADDVKWDEFPMSVFIQSLSPVDGKPFSLADELLPIKGGKSWDHILTKDHSPDLCLAKVVVKYSDKDSYLLDVRWLKNLRVVVVEKATLLQGDETDDQLQAGATCKKPNWEVEHRGPTSVVFHLYEAFHTQPKESTEAASLKNTIADDLLEIQASAGREKKWVQQFHVKNRDNKNIDIEIKTKGPKTKHVEARWLRDLRIIELQF